MAILFNHSIASAAVEVSFEAELHGSPGAGDSAGGESSAPLEEGDRENRAPSRCKFSTLP